MFWIRLEFIWNYATHLQTDANPPLELIFKFVDTLDKKDTKQHIKMFNSLDVSKKIYNAKLPVRLLVKENECTKMELLEQSLKSGLVMMHTLLIYLL